MQPTDFSPAVTALLASTFKLLHLADESACRGADNAVRYLSAAPIFAFDPTESRAMSEGGKEGTYYVTDGLYCTCKAKSWCKHCIGHRIALAQLALTDPAALIRAVVEQAAPAGADAADVAAVGRAAAIVAELDDAAYADLVAGLGPARPTAGRDAADALIDELYP